MSGDWGSMDGEIALMSVPSGAMIGATCISEGRGVEALIIAKACLGKHVERR